MITGGIVMQHEVDALVQVIHNVYHEVQITPEWYRSQLQMFIRQQRVKRAHKETIEEGVTDPTIVIDRVTRAHDQVSFDEESIVSFPLENFDLAERNPDMVPTGISCIDNGLGGGLGRGELGILCGITGLGKTTFGINFAWGAAAQGFEVRFASLELTARKIAARLYSRIASYPYGLILRGDPTGEKTRDQINQEVRELVAINAGDHIRRFRTWDFSNEVCTVEKLRTLVRRDRDAGCAPALIVVDWLDCLELAPTSGRENLLYTKEVRHKLGKHADDLAKLAVSENVAIWAPTQANAKADGKQRVGITNAAEGFGKSFKSSVFLGIGATHQDREYGVYQVTAAKNRDNPVFTARIRALLDYQRFEPYNENDAIATGIAMARGTQALIPPAAPQA